MELQNDLMKVIVKIADVMQLAKRFERSPTAAMRELVMQVREGVGHALERVMEAEIGLFLGQPIEQSNKRNGYATRTFGIKGVGMLSIRVPRDREGRFKSSVIPAGKRYEEAIEKDLALLHLAGISTRMLTYVSRHILGVKVSRQEVSNAMSTIVPAAKAFLNRALEGRRFVYLYIDGTNFHIRRTTVDKEPTLVVLGVDETGRKSVLSMVQGDKDARGAWEAVFVQLKERGLDASAVKLGIMDGLPGLAAAFDEAFRNARVARCWVHKARNVFPLVPRRYQAEFKTDWDAVAYAEGLEEAKTAFLRLKTRWKKTCDDAVDSLERDLEALLVHYEFPRDHWNALRTTNPIERVNKEFKRRSKSMETVSPEGLKALLAFTAVRLEYNWTMAPIQSAHFANLRNHADHETKRMETITKQLLN